MAEIDSRFEEFIVDRCEASKTFAFWNSYLEIMYILLAFIRATRYCLNQLRQQLQPGAMKWRAYLMAD